MDSRSFVLSVGISLVLFGCAAIPYKFYAPYPHSFSGVMVSKDEERDFQECNPSGGDNKCVVLFVHEWAKVLKDLADKTKRLEDAEKKLRRCKTD
jgi:hypothetical protein